MMDLSLTIKAVQRKVGVDDDGNPGPLTWAAIAKALGIVGQPLPVATDDDAATIDSRSESNIATLLPVAQAKAREFMRAVLDANIPAKITSGTRTYDEQEALWKKYKAGEGGRAAPPGHSNHNFGLAWDITLFREDGMPIWESPLYRKAGTIGRALGLVWGGDWGGDSDEPHFEVRPEWARDLSESAALAEYRARKDRGEAIA